MINRIEVSRQSAAQLHQEALLRGSDPREPYSFACEAATNRGLAIARVPVGDVRLRGGRALYDPDALLILHESTGDVFSQAFLVAHELGHIVCGGERDWQCVEEIDYLRSSESSGVGVDRVVDYSHRERREIQMDLFAREFLIPRFWIRKLHVCDGFIASEIAVHCRAPFVVVAQQLLDALMLPVVELPAEEANSKKCEPNPKQREAIDHRGVAYLLEAGPGTGKTQTLVRRVDGLVREGVAAEKLLVLTFSNKAANELAERIALSSSESASMGWIGTFHAFGLDLIRRFHDILGLPNDPRVLDRSAAIELLEEVYPSFELKHLRNIVVPAKPLAKILDAISRANDEVVDATEYERLSKIMLESATDDGAVERAEKCLEVAQVFRRYEELKFKKGFVDFGDLVAMPVRLCEQHERVATHLASVYEHVLVDEFQDVNRASIRLLKSLVGDGKNLWVVGDSKQSIYRFRGASSFNISRFRSEDFPKSESGSLEVSYRSVPEISNVCARFASKMRVAKSTNSVVSPARHSSGHVPELRLVETADEEFAAIADCIEELRHAGYEYRDQAILCTGNDRLSRIGKALEQMKIPVLHLGNLFEREEIRDLICMLSLLVDSRAMGLLRVCTMSGYETSLSDVSALLDHLREGDTGPMEWPQSLSNVEGISNEGRESLSQIGRLLTGFSHLSEPWYVLATILFDRTRIAVEVHKNETVRGISKGIAIWQFLNFVRTVPRGRGLPIAELLDRIRQLVLHSDERDLRSLPAAAEGINGVRLMTMHASKGLEFPVVHLPGLTGASIPRSASASLANSIVPPDGMIDGAPGTGLDAAREGLEGEQECLFFVALSRAKDRLFLYRNTRMVDGRSNPPSKFISAISGTIEPQRVTTRHVYLPEQGDGSVPVTLEEPFSFTDHQLALYENCPRRFLYTHVLKTGGRRKESSFMKLHVVVETVINELLSSLGDLPDASKLEYLLRTAMESNGFGEGSEDYLAVARELISFFIESKSGLSEVKPIEILLPIPGGAICIMPDQIFKDHAGRLLLRRIKTGHKLSKEDESLEVAILAIAAQSGSTVATAQIVHLSDQKIRNVELTPRKLENRKEKLTFVGEAIRGGKYPTDPSVTCPRCPAYFVCGPLPDGELVRKFSS